MPAHLSHRTLDPGEIARFSKDAAKWWDESGPFAPLHRLNPARMAYITSAICTHYNRDSHSLKSLSGLKIVDIGCGGGLACEPMARLGAYVTGIDGDAVAVNVASEHAKKAGLDIAYRNATTDQILPKAKNHFDVVLALEIVEHVRDRDAFVIDCIDLCKPGGLIIFSTLNRTFKSMALGKIAAEYILRWVPAGTHDWKKFVRPSELASSLRLAGSEPVSVTGFVYNPLTRSFETSSDDLDVNYFMIAEKK